MKNIAIYGFGGHGREVACLLKLINDQSPTWNLVGFFDDGEAIGKSNRYGRVLGGIDSLNNYNEPISIYIAIAEIESRVRIVNQISNEKVEFPNIIAPDVLFLDQSTVKIGKGNLIDFNSIISCDVQIGDFNLLNGGIILGHDSALGSYNTLMPSTQISGNCSVGQYNFFGLKSMTIQGIKVGDNTKIGAGSILAHNTQDGHFYFGNPAKRMT
jgi:sugar O-acyltransferase (sialic acid O-acetyltransferase NeuD family)